MLFLIIINCKFNQQIDSIKQKKQIKLHIYKLSTSNVVLQKD